MLRFITGTAGTGKTESLISKMKAAAEKGAGLVYLVPEQYSFEAERQMHRRLGPGLALGVEVLSFTRLCNGVFRAYGGLAGVSLNKTAKYLLMSVAVGETRESLSLYRKISANTAFIETLIEVCGEFKTAGITCLALSGFAEKCEDDALKRKLGELSLIYTAYQGLIERGYSDPDDDLIRTCELLENNDFFAGKTVFVDGFTTFMAAEFEVLGHIIVQSDDVFFAMTADGIFDDQRGMGVFSSAKSAMNRLLRLAGAAGVPVAEPEILTGQRRFSRPELSHLANVFARPDAPEYSGEYSRAIEIRSAADIYDEMDDVAAGIARLVRERGCRYGEIAVVARDPAPYSRAIESAFSRRGIPYLLNIPEDIENMPLASCVTAALNAVRGGFDATLTLLFAKSPLLGLEPTEVALLENYCYCWGVRGTVWHGDFANNPRGLAGVLTDEDKAVLERVNNARNAVITPLLHLKDALKNPDGKSFAQGIFALLQEVNAAENLAEYAQSLPKSDAFLDEAAQLWDSMMEILDIFGLVLGGYKMPSARLCELFKLAIGAAEITSPPQTLDQVLIGGADRVRPENARAVFVVGVNENIFPARISASGVFSDAERGALIDAGLEISEPSLKKASLEKYFAYFALTLPSEWLRVSYPRSDLRGRELLPSAIITQLREIFPQLPEPERDMLSGISSEKSAFEEYSRVFKHDTPFSASLKDFFKDKDYSATLERMRRAGERPPHQIADESLAKELFGRFMRLSPSRVERFYRCPFSYFVSDGLKVRARGKVEFTGLESGSVIHHVLQAMVQRHGGKGLAKLTDKRMSEEIAEIIREYLAGIADDPKKLSARLRFLFGRLNGTLSRLLKRLGEEFSQSGFEPAAFELPIKSRGEVEPLRLETVDGVGVIVEGIVDRVDVMDKNGKRYLRVVDYKSGAKTFALHDVLYGLNMQMLLYLFTIAENGANEFAGGIPAGVLYMPAREKYVNAARDSDAESVRLTREKEWRMNGLLLDDEEALRGMERDVAGVYIPVKLDKTGKPDAASSVASHAQMGSLARKVKEQITGMAKLLSGGAIEARPIEEHGGQACEYCDYREVCGFEQGDATRQISKLDRDEFFKILAEEERDATVD